MSSWDYQLLAEPSPPAPRFFSFPLTTRLVIGLLLLAAGWVWLGDSCPAVNNSTKDHLHLLTLVFPFARSHQAGRAAGSAGPGASGAARPALVQVAGGVGEAGNHVVVGTEEGQDHVSLATTAAGPVLRTLVSQGKSMDKDKPPVALNSLVSVPNSPNCLFVYGALGEAMLTNTTWLEGASVSRAHAWLYGSRLPPLAAATGKTAGTMGTISTIFDAPSSLALAEALLPEGLAIITHHYRAHHQHYHTLHPFSVDLVKGTLVCWATRRGVQKERLAVADRAHAYDPAASEQGSLRRGVVMAIKQDNSTAAALWYYTEDPDAIDKKDKERSFKCGQCGKIFLREGNLRNHLRIHTGETPFQCTLCDRSFSQSSHLKVHLRSHTGEKPYKCSICGKAFVQASDLRRHQQTHTGETPFNCSVCGKLFSEASRLKAHMRTHTEQAPFKCSECEKGFWTAGPLALHMRTHTGEKPYKCEICDMAFSESSSLEAHKRTHTGEKPHTCEVCGRSFGTSGNLRIHIRTHTGEKPYRCPAPGCKRAFASKSNLNVHMRYHSGEKPYQCDQCGQTFTESSKLKRHMLVHTGERAFKCSRCNRSFAHASSLKNHFRVHTGEKPFNCTICGRVFSQAQSVKAHLKTHKT